MASTDFNRFDCFAHAEEEITKAETRIQYHWHSSPPLKNSFIPDTLPFASILDLLKINIYYIWKNGRIKFSVFHTYSRLIMKFKWKNCQNQQCLRKKNQQLQWKIWVGKVTETPTQQIKISLQRMKCKIFMYIFILEWQVFSCNFCVRFVFDGNILTTLLK